MPGEPRPQKKADKRKKASPVKARAAARSKKKATARRVNEKIRKALLLRRQEILDLMENVSMGAKRGAVLEPGDLGDSAMASFEMDIATGILRSETRELQSIDEALARIEHGTYGVCESCGKRIPPARLQAVPHATQCLECKMQMEREHPRLDGGGRWRPAAARLSPRAGGDDASGRGQ